MDTFLFCIDYAARGTSGCKKCKVKIDKGALRVGKIVPNPFSDSGGEMKQWFHPVCLFESFKRARATTKKIESSDEIQNFDSLTNEDKTLILNLIGENVDKSRVSKPGNVEKIPVKVNINTSPAKPVDEKSKDNLFKEFRKICAMVAEEPSYLKKVEILKNFIKNGSNGCGFEGDLNMWIRLLMPGEIRRVYNLQSKQIIKLFSGIFSENIDEMLEHLENGDVAETIRYFFEKSSVIAPVKKSALLISEVDNYLESLSKMTREADQESLLNKVTKRCTGNDLKMVIRLIKHDLRINAGAKHILAAVHEDAYEVFKASKNLDDVLRKISDAKGTLSVELSLLTPVHPMLAEACRSFDRVIEKMVHGFYTEIKYDGERVQVHKKGSDFKYFSRSLKPVLQHKVLHLENVISQAFPHGHDMILDSEILMIDKDGNILPFGTLGIHKKAQFKDANVCLFVFDCIYFNGKSLLQQPLEDRRKILVENMNEIPNKIVLSEMTLMTSCKELKKKFKEVMEKNLEGLVVKDVKGVYEPGKRHWMKIKKDYINNGSMADSADLVVLGAWFGTGNKGGMMSIFLMGCYNPMTLRWYTVTKVHSGHDDASLAKIQDELQVVKISKDPNRLPGWLVCSKSMIPDFVVVDPKKSPVWEITGAEFTKNTVHTADGISIRFPRVTKIRDDKDWTSATNIELLKTLYTESHKIVDLDDDLDEVTNDVCSDNAYDTETDIDDEETPSKRSGSKGNSVSTPTKSPCKTPSKKKVKNGSLQSTPVKKQVADTVQSTPGRNNSFDNCPERSSQKKKMKRDFEDSTPIKMTNEGNFSYSTPCKRARSWDWNELMLDKETYPDVFKGVKMHIPAHIKAHTIMKRYFIAYGGLFLEQDQLGESTHFLENMHSHQGIFSGGQRVTVKWMWSCIGQKTLIPTD